MTQYTQGGSNPAAQAVPDLLVNVQPPPAAALPGAPSNLIGIVGSASWGPVNSPAVFSDPAGAVATFGTMNNRKHDLVTAATAAMLQGANAFVGVRQTDGTDVAASVVVQSTCITLTAKYTGSRGNGLQATIAAGTAASSWKVTLSMPGLPPETFDNLTGSGNALWLAMAAAINSGQSAARPKSQLVTATAGVGTTTPTAATLSFTGGTDGATVGSSQVNSTKLVGTDGTTRTGMYALRGTGHAIMVLADADDSTTWAAQLAFAKSELSYAVACSPSGDTISTFGTTMTSAAIDDPWITVILGDWVTIWDGQNNIARVISPQAFKAGEKAAVGPHNSTLNSPLSGIIATQKSAANQNYSTADLQLIAGSRGDVITMGSVGGAYPSFRLGRNASSDPGRNTDNYTTMTNYLARSMGLGLGQFVGRLITPEEMREASNTIGAFLENEKQSGRIAAYSVQIDGNNNPSSQIALGVQKATVLVQYLSVLQYFVVDLTGGATVNPVLPVAA